MTPWGTRTTCWLLAGVLLASASALAEDPKARAAREELERQLTQLVGKAPTRVRVDLEALDEPNYALEDAAFELDGRPIPSPLLLVLNTEGSHRIWSGDVAPGKHAVTVRLTYANRSSVVVSDEGGYSWKIGGTVSFDVNAGIEVQVRVVPKRDGTQPDVAKRFKLSLPAKPVMLAALDDGKMPEPPPKPLVDAGPTPEQLAAAEAAAKAKAAEEEKAKQLAAAEEARRLAEEEKQRKAEEAAEAKRLAAEEKQRKAEEAAEAKRLAAEERKRKAEEAAEAKRLAAEERKRKAEEAAEAKRRLALGLPPVEAAVGAGALPLDAGEPVAVAEAPDAGVALAESAPVDAGTPVAAAPPPAPEPAPEESFPWPLVAGAGALGLVVFLVLLARRRSRPPSLDE
jgi:hypothetical protein